MWTFPMTIGCNLSWRFIKMHWKNDVDLNFGRMMLRLARNQVLIIWDIFVFNTDVYFKDWYSMAFWIGDLFYLLTIKDPNYREPGTD